MAAAGASVNVVPAYQTVLETEGAADIRDRLAAGELDALTFTSSSTVKNFVEAIGNNAAVPPQTVLAAIGPITAQTCRELLREPDIVADAYTIDGLVDALMTRWKT
jgi:uroporphyrinogen III methyltransferase/synthase